MNEPRSCVPRAMDESAERVIAKTREWMEKAVIGLRLCPFAATPYQRGQIRYRVSEQTTASGLAEDLAEELRYLAAADPNVCETSLLIHPRVLHDFLDYNDFLDLADATLESLGLTGELQIASFHPAYQFAGTAPDDVENYTNRSPYPMLHLLREASIERAAVTPERADEIAERNIATLRELGDAGWRALLERDS
jgi:hypothetical protein